MYQITERKYCGKCEKITDHIVYPGFDDVCMECK